MKPFIFLIDVDEVLRQTLVKMVEVYNRHFPDNKLKYDDINNYITEISFPGIEETTGMTASHWFFQEHGKELFLGSNPFPYIKTDIEKLKEYGKVIILTYQKTYNNKFDTLEWLKINGIEADGICFLKDKSIISGTYMIDDNDWNFNGCQAEYGILVDAPYNKDINVNELKYHSFCKKIERANSLHDFVLKFEDAMKTLRMFETNYPMDKKYILKNPIKINDKITLGKDGDVIEIYNVFLDCLTPKAQIKQNIFWEKVDIFELINCLK